jgi:orotate phosphoribosyltransferase
VREIDVAETRPYIACTNGYSDRIFDDYDFKGIYNDLVKATRTGKAKIDYDTLVGTGMSGSLVVPYLAMRLKINWAVVRKNGESSHGNSEVGGRIGRRWLFVDDFISTGRTHSRVRAAIVEAVNRANRYSEELVAFATVHVGSFEYQKSHHGITLWTD